jgi:HNH endonuclease
MSISRRLRYEILRRDNYTCRYCGAKAPDVKLNVDAVVPEALGGSHKDPGNLVTACEDCNGGKTSSSPDAPLVADIAANALQWAQAIQVAQARMLDDLSAREANRVQFCEWWDTWRLGDDQRPIPKGPAWAQTVDQLVAAGLPMPTLKECIDLAMSRQKVKPVDTFRYMCGIAWRRVSDLQDSARAITVSAEGASANDGGARDETAIRDLFDTFLPEALRQAEADFAGKCAVENAIAGVMVDLLLLQAQIPWLLDMLPGGVGAEAQRAARVTLYNERGATFTVADFAERAITKARDILTPGWAHSDGPY